MIRASRSSARSGTCIIDAEGRCWCGQQWDGQKMLQRVSRHYDDVHQLLNDERSPAWLENRALATDCASHARLFFGSNDLGLEATARGTFTLTPIEPMRDALRADYAAMAGMIFGDALLASVEEVERRANE